MKRVIIGAIIAFLGIIWKSYIFIYYSLTMKLATFLETISSVGLFPSLMGANALLAIGLIILVIEYFASYSEKK